MQEVNLHKTCFLHWYCPTGSKGQVLPSQPSFLLGSPCKLYSIFSQFFCFFIITLVSEIVKEKLCRYRKYYRANKIGLSRAPAPTFTFETYRHSAIKKGDQGPPLQLFDSLLCRKIASLGVSSSLCWCSTRFDSAIPHSSLLTYYSILLIVFIFPQYLIFARGCILIP